MRIASTAERLQIWLRAFATGKIVVKGRERGVGGGRRSAVTAVYRSTYTRITSTAGRLQIWLRAFATGKIVVRGREHDVGGGRRSAVTAVYRSTYMRITSTAGRRPRRAPDP